MFDTLGGVSREDPLAYSQESLDALQVLPLCLIVHHVGDLAREYAGTATPLVDTHHGHTDRPWRITDRQLQVLVMCPYILFHEAVLDEEVESIEYLGVALFPLE